MTNKIDTFFKKQHDLIDDAFAQLEIVENNVVEFVEKNNIDDNGEDMGTTCRGFDIEVFQDYVHSIHDIVRNKKESA